MIKYHCYKIYILTYNSREKQSCLIYVNVQGVSTVQHVSRKNEDVCIYAYTCYIQSYIYIYFGLLSKTNKFIVCQIYVI